MNYSNIKISDVGNGPGVRTTLFVSGCNHNCPGCFNEMAFDFNAGKKFDAQALSKVLDSCDKAHISGLSILGGEPMDPKNQKGVLEIIKAFRKRFNDTKTIWVWSGYIFDQDFKEGGRAYTEYTEDILKGIDYIVDGPFMAHKVDITLKYRGSSNQRIIELKDGKAVSMEGDE